MIKKFILKSTKQYIYFSFPYKKIVWTLNLYLLVAIPSMGQFVPVTFHQYNSVKNKELSVGLNIGRFLGAESNYSLSQNLHAFASFNFDFIPYTYTILGGKFKVYPNTLSINLGGAYFVQLRDKSSKKICFKFGAGMTSLKTITYTAQNIKHNTTESSINSGFFELDYILIRKKSEHFFSGRFGTNYFHYYKEFYEKTGNYFVNGQNLITYNFAAGYGLKYTIRNFKIGFQVGYRRPFNDLVFTTKSNFSTVTLIETITITEYGAVLNLNMVYSFELRKSKENSVEK